MASGIYENDWMFSGNGIRPWHEIGTVVDGCPTSEEAIKLAKLNWDVIQSPVYLKDGTEIPNLFANVRSDTNEVLGTVHGRYRIVQNTESFDFVDDIIQNSKGIECRYETAGSLFNGKRVFMLVRLPDINLVGDEVENYLFFSNSHDGSSGLMAGISNIRVVCNNTLQLAERNASRMWNIRHTESLQSKKLQAEQALGLALTYTDRIKEDAEKMAMQKINEEKFFQEFFKRLELSEKNKEKVLNNVLKLYTDKDDLQNFRGSAWGMYNAVADMVSNGEPLRQTSTSADWKMNNWMNGYKMLEVAQDVLLLAA